MRKSQSTKKQIFECSNRVELNFFTLRRSKIETFLQMSTKPTSSTTRRSSTSTTNKKPTKNPSEILIRVKSKENERVEILFESEFRIRKWIPSRRNRSAQIDIFDAGRWKSTFETFSLQNLLVGKANRRFDAFARRETRSRGDLWNDSSRAELIFPVRFERRKFVDNFLWKFRDFKEKIRQKQSIDESLVESWIDRIESNRKKSFKSMRVKGWSSCSSRFSL